MLFLTYEPIVFRFVWKGISLRPGGCSLFFFSLYQLHSNATDNLYQNTHAESPRHTFRHRNLCLFHFHWDCIDRHGLEILTGKEKCHLKQIERFIEVWWRNHYDSSGKSTEPDRWIGFAAVCENPEIQKKRKTSKLQNCKSFGCRRCRINWSKDKAIYNSGCCYRRWGWGSLWLRLRKGVKMEKDRFIVIENHT